MTVPTGWQPKQAVGAAGIGEGRRPRVRPEDVDTLGNPAGDDRDCLADLLAELRTWPTTLKPARWTLHSLRTATRR